jgi:hypothetical protein
MLPVTLRTWGLTLVVGVLGALLGFGLDLALGQSGWVAVGASIGLCGGAMFAGSLMNRPAAPAPAAAGAPVHPSPAEPPE